MSRVLYRIGHFAGRHPWRVLAAWVLIAVVSVMLNSNFGGAPDEHFTIPGAESQRAADAIEDRFPQETLNTSNVVFHDEDGLTEPAVKAAVEQAVTQLAEGKHVIDVADPYDPRGPTVSKDGTTAFVMNDASDAVQFICCEYDAAECDASTDSSRTRTRYCDRQSIAIGNCEEFRNIIYGLRQNDTIRMAVANETRIA